MRASLRRRCWPEGGPVRSPKPYVRPVKRGHACEGRGGGATAAPAFSGPPRAQPSGRARVKAVGTGCALPALARARTGPAPAGAAIAPRSTVGSPHAPAVHTRLHGAWCGHAGAGPHSRWPPMTAGHHGDDGTPAAACRRWRATRAGERMPTPRATLEAMQAGVAVTKPTCGPQPCRPRARKSSRPSARPGLRRQAGSRGPQPCRPRARKSSRPSARPGLRRQAGSRGPQRPNPGGSMPPRPPGPLRPPMRFIIFIRPPPFICFIMPCICSNWLSRRLTSCT